MIPMLQESGYVDINLVYLDNLMGKVLTPIIKKLELRRKGLMVMIYQQINSLDQVQSYHGKVEFYNSFTALINPLKQLLVVKPVPDLNHLLVKVIRLKREKQLRRKRKRKKKRKLLLKREKDGIISVGMRNF